MDWKLALVIALGLCGFFYILVSVDKHPNPLARARAYESCVEKTKSPDCAKLLEEKHE